MKTYLKALDDLDKTIEGMKGDHFFKHPTVYYVIDRTGTKKGSLSEFKARMYKSYLKTKEPVQQCPLNEFDGADCHLMGKEWK